MTKRISLIISTAIFLMIVTPSIALSGNKLYKTTITGYIYIVNKNEAGKPVAIGIMVDKEYEIDCYHIEDKARTNELVEYISHSIQVNGVVSTDKSGKKIIKIRSWKPAPL